MKGKREKPLVATSVSGQDKSNLDLLLATRAGKIYGLLTKREVKMAEWRATRTQKKNEANVYPS